MRSCRKGHLRIFDINLDRLTEGGAIRSVTAHAMSPFIRLIRLVPLLAIFSEPFFMNIVDNCTGMVEVVSKPLDLDELLFQAE